MAYEPGETWHIAGYLANLLGMINFMTKAVLFVTLMMWVRWTLPRLRIDQVMTTCLKYCTPLAAICFLGAAGWIYLLPGGLVLPSTPYGMTPEAPAVVEPFLTEGHDAAHPAEAPVTAGAPAADPTAARSDVSVADHERAELAGILTKGRPRGSN
jgi:NADH-quinone oxidoreductase subunit H